MAWFNLFRLFSLFTSAVKYDVEIFEKCVRITQYGIAKCGGIFQYFPPRINTPSFVAIHICYVVFIFKCHCMYLYQMQIAFTYDLDNVVILTVQHNAVTSPGCGLLLLPFILSIDCWVKRVCRYANLISHYSLFASGHLHISNVFFVDDTSKNITCLIRANIGFINS